jgi:hypothetical protein
MTQDELKGFITKTKLDTYELLKHLRRTPENDLNSYGVKSYGQALQVFMKQAEDRIEKAIQKYEKENPD